MKVVLFSIGTRGDIEPFLTIAQLLKRRDCEIICVFPEQFRTDVTDLGLPFKGFTEAFIGWKRSQNVYWRTRFMVQTVRLPPENDWQRL